MVISDPYRDQDPTQEAVPCGIVGVLSTSLEGRNNRQAMSSRFLDSRSVVDPVSR